MSAADINKLAQTLRELRADQRVFVDFDHTLLLSNSTELFVGSARPRFVFALMMKLIGLLRPWKLAGQIGAQRWRDVVRVTLVMMLSPGIRARFERSAPDIFQAQLNPALDYILARVPQHQIVIVSFGFDFVLRAMLKGSRYETCALVAPNLNSMARARKDGKVRLLDAAGFQIDAARDIVITDSARDDADILSAAQHPFVIEWPGNSISGAFSGQYLPFVYTAHVKRSPGFLIKQVFLEELPIVLLAFGFAMGSGIDLQRLIALTLLFLAAFIIYEIGYAENDRVGAATEAKPKLGKNYAQYADYRMEPDAWIWAGLVSALAIGVMGADNQARAAPHAGLVDVTPDLWLSLVLLAAWTGVLGLLRGAFWVFNQVSLQWRVFAYLPLHLIKYLAPLILFNISVAGLMLVAAQIVRTWSMYAVRRAGGDETFLPSQFIRLCFFVLLLPILFVARGTPPNPQDWPILLMLAFCILRAMPESARKFRPATA